MARKRTFLAKKLPANLSDIRRRDGQPIRAVPKQIFFHKRRCNYEFQV